MTKNRKNMVIWIIITLLLISLLILIFTVQGSEKSYDIEDRCGPMLNFISHTIQNEGACRAQCRSRCETEEMVYKRVEFTESSVGCHTCTCFCKDTFFG